MQYIYIYTHTHTHTYLSVQEFKHVYTNKTETNTVMADGMQVAS